MKVTKIQILTILFIIGFGIYELWYIPGWLNSLGKGNPPIRLDLIIFPPILLFLIIISVIQFIRKK